MSTFPHTYIFSLSISLYSKLIPHSLYPLSPRDMIIGLLTPEPDFWVRDFFEDVLDEMRMLKMQC